jgi:uncharacterized protein YraI
MFSRSVYSLKTRLIPVLALCAALLASLCNVSPVSAQTCADCEVYAATELNLRQDPSVDSAVLRIIPSGAVLYRTAGEVTNEYAPVTYDSVPGWVVSLGIVSTPEEVDSVGGIEAPTDPAPAASADARYTLEPLVLRGGPSADAEPILTMPQGATVTLTREGAENGYVTVDYDGATGWAYADFLGGDTPAPAVAPAEPELPEE